MVDIVFCLCRKRGISPEEFRRYWREEHAPLVQRHAAALGILGYSQLHTLDTPIAEAIRASRRCAAVDFDGVALVSFASVDTLAATAATPERAAAGNALLEDERRFLDLERCAIWVSEHHEVIA